MEAVEGAGEKLRRDVDLMRIISGELFIRASDPGEDILPPLMAKFNTLHPAVTIRVEVSDSMTVMNRVRENAYDTGFCGAQPDGHDLEYFKISGDEIVLIVPADHPFAAKEEIGPEELEGEPFIFRESSSGTQRSLEKLLEKSGYTIGKLTPRLVLGSTQAVISGVAAGRASLSSQAWR